MRTPNARDHENRSSKAGRQGTPGRREFLGLLGGGAAAGAGLPGTAAPQGMPVVAMGNNYFDPVGLYVESGSSVRFEIEAGSHSATAYRDRIPSAAPRFDSGTLSEGWFEHTFETPGTYDYYCIPHRSMGMVGRIVVGEAGGPAEITPIPNGDVPDSAVIVDRGSVSIDEFDESRGDSQRETMGSGQGMMNGGGPGWMMLVPIGFLTAVIGLVGGAVYWLSRRGRSERDRDDPVTATLEERYDRGDIDEAEHRRRRDDDEEFRPRREQSRRDE